MITKTDTNHAVENQAEFRASLDELEKICNIITTAAKESGMEDANLWKLETSVDEACTNIVCYGYKGIKNGKLLIRWGTQNNTFVVTIEDTGRPFDQSQPTNPDFNPDICKRKVGGLGRFIMHQFLDEMKYKRINNRNLLTLVKKLYNNNSEH